MTPIDPEAWLFRSIVQEIPEAVIFADRTGVIRLWNSGAETMFGYSAGEAVGQTLDLIIPERLQPRHWDGYHKVIATGVTRYARELLATPAIRKDGRRISIEFSITLLKEDTGKVLGAAAIIRDVTARWEEEKTQRQSGSSDSPR
ncbi:MAG TPA: PAS domain S-box protein [Methylomirabilota bacterium]|nr:PAS domain S-box protein [Methylomirabilota bacterium]